MAVQAAVFRRAITQIMGRVEAEFLADLYHARHIGLRALRVKD
jgi:hypothetical protein